MRVVETKLYTFNELSDSAKQRAIDLYRDGETDFPWESEWLDSLKAFVNECLVITMPDFRYGMRWSAPANDALQLSGIRAWKWLHNNIFQKYQDKYLNYLDAAKLNSDGGCTLTGCCSDCALFDPIAQIIDKPWKIQSLEQLFYECLQTWENAYEADRDWYFSDESIAEMIEMNEYEFTENGTLV